MKTFKVNIIESERGWGSRVDETKSFNTKEEADAFIKKYNERYNSSPITPDWYMIAEPAY